MTFSATLKTRSNEAFITLSGDLDASTANEFKAKVEEAALTEPQALILDMTSLDYMASAGLRVLIFANQKMGQDVDIYLVSPQELVLNTIEKTGFHHSVQIVDTYESAVTA